ncbi:TOMM precursor leader peptide-binding protein [Kibdelosporangium persicum]|uniref:Ribosomal protein S12 methylthiotransferase accessory factor n=1 Tax=Kibdelosporangium persicum TaxID=2698649 RepID=A0ABX2EW00_9PSEU|nr:TOMM precursor leader peptide-binding protein [Kibdelosporangium persicum]NRN63203.1 Ribosomal protein S12 methylthiotransferase accessory factor [Kibdelosporangium persicum]
MAETGPAWPIGFKRHLRAEVAEGDGVFVFAEDGVTVLRGTGIGAVAGLLDVPAPAPDLMAARPGGLAPGQVGHVLARLAESGLLSHRRPAPGSDPAADAYWEAAGIDPADAVTGIDGARVRVDVIGDVDPGPARTALAGIGPVRVVGDGPADLAVVLCDDYLNPTLAEADAACRAAGIPWLPVKPLGTKIWLGPVFTPGPGCWHCLAARLRVHRVAESSALLALGHSGPAPYPLIATPTSAALAGHFAAMEVSSWLAGRRRPGQRSVWTFDTLGRSTESHELRPRPQCPVCGDPGLMRALARTPVTLNSRSTVDSGGGHRSSTAVETLDRYRHLISPVTGVVKQIQQDSRGPAMFNSFRSGANLAVSGLSIDNLRSAVRFETGGKGVTPLDAEVGALCEAIERYSGTFAGDEERVPGSLRSLGDDAIHPNTCQLYDPRQYTRRRAWNAAHAPFQYVCDPLDVDAELDWTPVWSLTNRRFRLLPTGLLYFNAPAAPGPRYVFADSNGNAAGSSLEDAVLQGALEIVERDAVALWWYNRLTMPGVDLTSFADEWIAGLREVYAELGRELWVLDVTSDVGIPVMVAVSRKLGPGPEDITFGFGAHLDPRIALRRALTELNQLMPPLIASDDAYGCEDIDAVRWWQEATLAGQPYLAPARSVRPRTPADYPDLTGDDLLDEVNLVRARLERLGLEVLVLDQTRPDTGLPVVKVIVPGMRHFWTRFAPGRLFDVPVRQGLLSRPRRYDELNPYPMFL